MIFRHKAGVIFLGAVGKHLNKDDPAVLEIIEALVIALSTPSETVQKAVADCLTPLVQAIKGSEHSNQLIERLLKQTLDGGSKNIRKISF